jgi:hypothetical protein
VHVRFELQRGALRRQRASKVATGVTSSARALTLDVSLSS